MRIQWPKSDDLEPRSRSKVKVKFSQKWVKNQRTGHNLDAISPTDFILGTKVQRNKAHSMAQVPMILTKGQGQRSMSKFSQNGLNDKLAISWMLFHPQTSSYLLSQHFVTHLGVALLCFFQWLHDILPEHIPHRYSAEMKEKTTVIPMRLILKDEKKWGMYWNIEGIAEFSSSSARTTFRWWVSRTIWLFAWLKF